MNKNIKTKKRAAMVVGSSVVVCASGIGLAACASPKEDNGIKSPVVKEKRAMNPNVPNITVGDFRLQILDKDTVRFEYKYQNPIFKTYDWLDDDTMFIPDRTLYEGVKDYSVVENTSSKIVSFGDIEIIIPKNIQPDLKGIVVNRKVNGSTRQIYNSDNQQKYNNGELPNPEDTQDAYELIDYPRIIEPPYGYSTANLYVEPYVSHLDYFRNTSGFEIQNHKDIYLTFPRKDAKALRKQYRNLAGPAEMVRLSTLGAWDSRYYPYNEWSAQKEIDLYNQYDLPLDNLVIDTDWRAGFDGKGYFVNETLFPNMAKFLESVHDQNIEVCFNDHPEPQKNDRGEELNVLNTKEVDFRQANLRKLLEMGLDTWWYDRNWSTSLIVPEGTTEEWLNHEVWGDYLYNNVTKQTWMLQSMTKYHQYGELIYKRPTTMSNVIQIRNGNWGSEGEETGFTDSASHRFSIQWTGDQNSTMLDTEIANVIKTGIRAMPYMSSDLAGHTNPVADDYYYQRWIQYGSLSPIFRIHCTRDLSIQTQPWLRGEDVVDNFRNWINLRYRLMPLYYSLAHESYENGMPICRALAFNYPTEEGTWGLEDEYLLGNNILFAPCVETLAGLFEGKWYQDDAKTTKGYTAKYYNNKDFSGDPVETTYEENEINFNIDKFAQESKKLIDKTTDYSVVFEGNFVPAKDGEIVLNSDDRIRITLTDGSGIEKTAEDWNDHAARDLFTKINVSKDQTYKIKLEFVQAGGGAELYFKRYDSEKSGEKNKEVYLPKGEWLDLFHGDIYQSGGQKFIIDKEYGVNENAVFMRLGSMTPLIDNARNTKEQDWTKVVYDVYPTTRGASDSGVFYDDDHESIAYQHGYYHTSGYNCYFDSSTNEFVIKLDPSKGWYIGDDEIANREFKIRLHKTCNEIDDTVLVDGRKVQGKTYFADPSIAMPLNYEGASRTEDVIEVTIPSSSIRLGHEIRVKIA